MITMKFDSKLLKQHLDEVAEMAAYIKNDIRRLEDGEKKEELLSAINLIEKYSKNLNSCVSVYRKCEKEICR